MNTPIVYLVKINGIRNTEKFLPDSVKIYNSETNKFEIYAICTDFGNKKLLSLKKGTPDFTKILPRI
jgi:hypothetical protein